jgi:hypothetical protein
MKKLIKLLMPAIGAVLLYTPTALAYPYYDYYDYYDGYYDSSWDDDDWFYDYYDYDYDTYDGYYDHYDHYNYDADLFDWEEDGLFE